LRHAARNVSYLNLRKWRHLNHIKLQKRRRTAAKWHEGAPTSPPPKQDVHPCTTSQPSPSAATDSSSSPNWSQVTTETFWRHRKYENYRGLHSLSHIAFFAWSCMRSSATPAFYNLRECLRPHL